jgi:hypothetical protein
LWELIGIGGLALGLARVAVMKFAARSSRSEGPPSQQNGFLSSIAFAAVMIACEPFLLAVGVAICLQMLWHGRIPIIGVIWSPARAAKRDQENWGLPARSN